MKHIILFLIFVSQIFASTVYSTVKNIDNLNNEATININKIDVGISGFVIHKIDDKHEIILKNATVSSYDEATHTASLSLSDFDGLMNNALPDIKYDIAVGDKVVLAFGYSRALLISPSEELYYRITKAIKVQWIHPDLFTTILALNGHLAPTKDDFAQMSRITSVGLIYFFIHEKLYTVDAKSLKILSISLAPLKQESTVLPYYTRLHDMSNHWWDFGDGTQEVKDYNSYYYSLLLKYNPNNKELIKEMNK
jgi:hypothetical protein